MNIDVKETEGDYKLCLDNKISTFSDKTVFFEISVEDPNEEGDYDEYIGKTGPATIAVDQVEIINCPVCHYRNVAIVSHYNPAGRKHQARL